MFSELRLAYTTTLELPKRVCETFSATLSSDTDGNLEIQNSAKEDSSGSVGSNDINSESDSATEIGGSSSSEINSESYSGTDIGGSISKEINFPFLGVSFNSESDSGSNDNNSGSDSESNIDNNSKTGSESKIGKSSSENDGNFGKQESAKEDSSGRVVENISGSNQRDLSSPSLKSGSNSSSGINSEYISGSIDNSAETTSNKIIIRNYGYESEAVLKSTACHQIYEPIQILSSLITLMFTDIFRSTVMLNWNWKFMI